MTTNIVCCAPSLCLKDYIIYRCQIRMLHGCLYHLLGYILPPPQQLSKDSSQEDGPLPEVIKQEFPRLEYLSACAFMNNENVVIKFIQNIPCKLFPALFQAAISNYYFSYKNNNEILQALKHILNHWPQEIFILNKVLPPLPPSVRLFTCWVPCPNKTSHQSPLFDIQENLDSIYKELLILIVQSLEKDNDSIIKMDISTQCAQVSNILDPKTILKCIESKTNYSLPSKNKNIQFTTDIYIDCLDKKGLDAISAVTGSNLNPNAGMSVSFSRAVFYRPARNIVTPIFKDLAKAKVEYLELEWCDLDNITVTCICCYLPHIKGLSLSKNLSSLTFLSSLNNLEQLNLSYNNLKGILGPLGSLTKGLKYLRLAGCSIRNDDLEEIVKGPHGTTLCHLDLSGNDLSQQRDYYGLIALCQHLTALQILQLDSCNLHCWTPNLICRLVETLALLPDLSIVQLKYNFFTKYVITSQICKLGNNIYLKYISLSIPDEITLINNFDVMKKHLGVFKSQILQQVHNNRETYIYVQLVGNVGSFNMSSIL
ncbi:unnamed protein product [Meganyctiphanes norvegica]|uniref:Leucine-rich repeat-containing protein 14 n=1 Tax=Meganyctiphanes norvegica TaxID=48144 RepID=A0AAV2PW45_MEGNR